MAESLHTAKNTSYTYLFILSLLIPLLLTSCDSLFGGDDTIVCTSEFVQSTVLIADELNKEPIESVQVAVSNEENGETYDICEAGTCMGNPEIRAGEYIIFHDGFQDDIDADGEEIIVQGTKGDSISFSQEFTFGHDECHIQKFAGPDTIFVSTKDK